MQQVNCYVSESAAPKILDRERWDALPPTARGHAYAQFRLWNNLALCTFTAFSLGEL
jgi:hypothetical protein